MPTLTRPPTSRLLLLAALLSLSGCLGRNAPPQRHYVLGVVGAGHDAAEVAPHPDDAGRRVIGLRPPRLADYLNTPFIVVRRGLHEVEFSEYHRWGEELGRAINRTLAVAVAARMPGHTVEVAPWSGGRRPDQVIQVHILRFEGVAPEAPGSEEGRVHLLATWEILDPLDGALLARGSTEVREEGWTVGDFDGLVGMLDEGLDRLAEELVLRLGR